MGNYRKDDKKYWKRWAENLLKFPEENKQKRYISLKEEKMLEDL